MTENVWLYNGGFFHRIEEKRDKTMRMEAFIRRMINSLLFWAVCGGIVAVCQCVFTGAGQLSKITVMSEYFMYQYCYEKIDYSSLLVSVLIVRIPVLVAILVGSRTSYYIRIKCLLGFVGGYAFAYVTYILILRYGVCGFLMEILLLTPHAVFYCYSIWRLFFMKRGERGKRNLGILVYFFGILLETYVNPLFVQSFSRFF